MRSDGKRIAYTSFTIHNTSLIMNNFQPFEVVDRDSETQLQVAEKLSSRTISSVFQRCVRCVQFL